MKKNIFWALCLFVHVLFAQEKEGKPNLKPYKETLKEAKNGNISAIMQIAEVCQGHFLATHEVKSYKKAIEWFKQVSDSEKDLQAMASRNLFLIYHNGGFGIETDENEAQNWFETANQRSQIYKKYYDKKDLYFKDFFYLTQRANENDQKAQLLLARQYFEFQISYPKALNYMSKVLKTDSTNLDAQYLLEKWNAIFKRYRAYQTAKLPEFSEFGIMNNYAQKNCRLAKMELAEAAHKIQDQNYKLTDNQIVSLLSSFNYQDDFELEFKRLFMLQRYQKGTERFASIRRLADLKKNVLKEYQTNYADSLFEKLQNLDSQIGSIGGLGEFLVKNPEFEGMNFDLTGYRNDFDGHINEAIALQEKFQNPKIRIFAGESNFANYQKELEQKIGEVLQKASDTSLKLIEFKFALENNAWLNRFYEKYKPILDEKMLSLGINETNLGVYVEEYLLKDRTFNSFSEVQDYINSLYTKISDLNNRNRLISFVKKKGILDIYGYEPFANKIQEIESSLRNTAWLQPEGQAMYFWYTSDSPNWFSGKIDFQNMTYHYEVRKDVGEKEFELLIKRIVGKQESYLAFHSQIRTQQSLDKKTFEIDVLNSQIKRYKWEAKNSEFVKVFYTDQQNSLKAEEFGGMRSYSTKSAVSETVLNSKIDAAEFSEKAAIRSAVRYFVCGYNNALKNN